MHIELFEAENGFILQDRFSPNKRWVIKNLSEVSAILVSINNEEKEIKDSLGPSYTAELRAAEKETPPKTWVE